MARTAKATQTINLPNGHVVHFIPTDPRNKTAYILEVRDGERLLSSTCSCNGVTISCPDGTSPNCDCTTNPPTLSCA
jgi:hypothetical protein